MDALFQAILDAPDDDAPRLVYADWLEEGGRAEHAELIRAQCRLPRQGQRTAAAKRLVARAAALRRAIEGRLDPPPGWGDLS